LPQHSWTALLLRHAILELATQEPANTKAPEASPLTLTIKSDKQVCEVGETLSFQVTITNNSDKEMILFWSDEPPGGFVMEDGPITDTNVLVTFSIPRRKEKAQPLYIKPKTEIRKDIATYKQSRFFYGKVHATVRYEFKGAVNFKTTAQQELCLGPITSNTIEIEVVEKGKYITEAKAIEIAKKAAVGVMNIPADAPIDVALQNGSYVVTFKITEEDKTVPSGGQYRGPDYYAQIKLDAKSGEVQEKLVGS
jgi:hypothetical protein